MKLHSICEEMPQTLPMQRDKTVQASIKPTPEVGDDDQTQLDVRVNADQPNAQPNRAQQVADAFELTDKMQDNYRAGKDPNFPLNFEQRLDIALRDSKKALEIAGDVNQKLEGISQAIKTLPQKLAGQSGASASKPSQSAPSTASTTVDDDSWIFP